MKNPVKFLLAGAALVVGLSASAAQADNRDAVRDSNGNIVKAVSGNCVRSKWENTFDECAGAPAAAPLAHITKSVYFAFNKAKLTPESKKTLDILVADILAKGGSVSAVRVAGYADKMGSTTLNEKLSKKRADAVRTYLTSKGVIIAQIVETRWFGESMPGTDCPKKMKRAKRIKCLQPDRRVDVEIDYTQSVAPAAQ